MSTSRLSLSHTNQGLELTRDEFADAEFEIPWRYERVGGRLAVMAPAGHGHYALVEGIRDQFIAYRFAHRDCIAHILTDAWIMIDDRTERIADLAVYLASGKGQVPERIPEIVFEIVSGGSADRRRDYEEKRAEYERAGVREYVIVDRLEHCVTVLRREDGQFSEHQLGSDGRYTTPLLPGLEISLAGII